VVFGSVSDFRLSHGVVAAIPVARRSGINIVGPVYHTEV
jgi:hypothetical protein